MAFILLTSTGGFSAANTSRVLRPLLLWVFPDISEANIQLVHLIVRKLAHLTEYAVLGWLAARAFVTSSVQVLSRYWFIAALLIVIFQAAMDEYHQSFVATRTGSPYDSVIDITGGVLALLLFAYMRARSKSVRQTSVCR